MAMIRIQGANEKENGIYYEVDTGEKPLGVGGMGQVYKGCMVHANGVRKDVAIKFLFDDLPAHVIERAQREASVRIHNENLVEMFGFIQVDEVVSPGVVHHRYHVVSELLHGVMLYDLLKGKTTDNNGNEVPFARELCHQYEHDRYTFSLFIIRNVLSGIMALHDKGYIHRDIDPSNIMITSDGKVKIIDFGIAKRLSDLTTQDKQLTTAGQFMGKAAYASPELVVGDVVHQNETTDIYAVGIMLFQLVTGHLPFEGATHELLDLQLRGKMPLHRISQKQLRKVVGKATEKKQVDRYHSAAEFRVAIEQLDKAALRNEEHGKTFGIETILQYKKSLIGAGAALVVIAGITGVVLKDQQTKEQQMRMALIEEENALKQRIEMKKGEILDSGEAIFVVDSLSQVVVKSSALLTHEATEYLLDRAKADSGLKILDRVIEKRYTTSSDAAYLLGRLHYEGQDTSEDIQLMKSNLTGKVKLNNQKAHEMILLSLDLDSTSYKALYELGCDHYAGEARTGIPDSRDIEKALDCFNRALEFATRAADEEYIEKCSRRIRELTP